MYSSFRLDPPLMLRGVESRILLGDSIFSWVLWSASLALFSIDINDYNPLFLSESIFFLLAEADVCYLELLLLFYNPFPLGSPGEGTLSLLLSFLMARLPGFYIFYIGGLFSRLPRN